MLTGHIGDSACFSVLFCAFLAESHRGPMSNWACELEPMKYSQKGQTLPSGVLDWLICTRQDQSSTEKYLNPKQLRMWPGSGSQLAGGEGWVRQNRVGIPPRLRGTQFSVLTLPPRPLSDCAEVSQTSETRGNADHALEERGEEQLGSFFRSSGGRQGVGRGEEEEDTAERQNGPEEDTDYPDHGREEQAGQCLLQPPRPPRPPSPPNATPCHTATTRHARGGTGQRQTRIHLVIHVFRRIQMEYCNT